MEITNDELNTPLLENESKRTNIDITDSLRVISKLKPVEFFYTDRRLDKKCNKVGLHIKQKDIPLRYVKKKKILNY